MEIRQYICIMAAFSLLLLSCIETAWAEKKPILDDDGNVITEWEIKENMNSHYRIGCVSGGCLLSAVPAGIGGALIAAGICVGWFYDGYFDRCSKDTAEVVFVGSTVALEIAAIIASYYIGKRLDRRRAINHIKARRRHQKKHGLSKQEITEGILLPIAQGAF